MIKDLPQYDVAAKDVETPQLIPCQATAEHVVKLRLKLLKAAQQWGGYYLVITQHPDEGNKAGSWSWVSPTVLA